MDFDPINDSKHLRGAAWDPALRELHIKFHNGDVYAYPVSQDMHSQLMNSNSRGEFFHRHIKHTKGRKVIQ
jgi:KTSC domain